MEKKPLTHVEMSRLGGIARAAKLTKERRSAIAKKASKARWKKARAYPAAVILLLLSLATPLSAQEKSIPINWAPIVFAGAGQFADGKATTFKLSHGCGESNSRAFGQQPANANVWMVKGVTLASMTGTLWLLQKNGHPKVAKWLGIFGGAVGFGAAGYNLTVNCGGAR